MKEGQRGVWPHTGEVPAAASRQRGWCESADLACPARRVASLHKTPFGNIPCWSRCARLLKVGLAERPFNFIRSILCASPGAGVLDEVQMPVSCPFASLSHNAPTRRIDAPHVGLLGPDKPGCVAVLQSCCVESDGGLLRRAAGSILMMHKCHYEVPPFLDSFVRVCLALIAPALCGADACIAVQQCAKRGVRRV